MIMLKHLKRSLVKIFRKDASEIILVNGDVYHVYNIARCFHVPVGYY